MWSGIKTSRAKLLSRVCFFSVIIFTQTGIVDLQCDYLTQRVVLEEYGCIHFQIISPNFYQHSISLHVPVLSNETCMIHAHYALRDLATSMHESFHVEFIESCRRETYARDLHVLGAPFQVQPRTVI